MVSFLESVDSSGNQHLRQRVASPTQAAYNSRGENTPCRERRGNGEGVERGVVGENQPCNYKVDKENGVDIGSHKRKRSESVSLLSHLIGSCRRGCLYVYH